MHEFRGAAVAYLEQASGGDKAQYAAVGRKAR